MNYRHCHLERAADLFKFSVNDIYMVTVFIAMRWLNVIWNNNVTEKTIFNFWCMMGIMDQVLLPVVATLLIEMNKDVQIREGISETVLAVILKTHLISIQNLLYFEDDL